MVRQGTEQSTSRLDSSVPLTYHDPRDLFSKEMQNLFTDSFRFKNPILGFLKETNPLLISYVHM